MGLEHLGIELSEDSQQVILAFIAYLIGVMALGIFAHRYLRRGEFVKEYFLGNRGLGPWVLALTVAATAISGGTFMGFPSLIYSNGWIMALWIASYMVVPLTAMVFLGKRLNQVARVSGSVTVPDVLRDRFQWPVLGIVSTVLILFFLTFNLVAQFKGGGLVMKEALGMTEAHGWKPEKVQVFGLAVDKGYFLGLMIFAITVVAYTTYGGFWAVTWTDVLEGLVMLIGVVVMAILAVQAVAPVTVAGEELHGLAAATERLRQQDAALVHGPGPTGREHEGYLPIGLGLSFFLMWSVMAPGQPSGMVRLMSFKDSNSLRRAMVLVAFYYVLTYLSLLVIFICARAIFPTQYLGKEHMGSEGEPDSIMPAMVRHLTADRPWVGGLLLAAPYAAIMSTVAAFLLMISSSLVRDIYQRTINPNVSERAIKVGSYLVTGLIGVVVLIGALNPPAFLQYVIVFTGAGMGCSFLLPMALAVYWPRATREGVLASMLGGFFSVFGLYAWSWSTGGKFEPSYLGLHPLVYGLIASVVLGVGVSWLTRPNPELTKKYFPS